MPIRISKPGVKAYASPRGDPSKKFPLRFERVEPYVIPKKSLTGDNTERVDTRVLQVIYQVDRDEPGLFVGMQVDVFFDTGEGDKESHAPNSSPTRGEESKAKQIEKPAATAENEKK